MTWGLNVPSIVVVVADLHINCTMALCPPVFELDGGGKYYQNNTQKWIWKSWLDFVGRVKQAKKHFGAEVYVVFNGDLVDVNTHSAYELISPNPADIIKATRVAIAPLIALGDYNFIVRGTEAHTGGAAWIEEQVAQLVGAEKDTNTYSWWWLPMEINGVHLGFAHHPSTNSSRPWTRGNAASRQAQILMDEYFGEENYPQLVHYGHFHHDEDSWDNHKIRVVYEAPWVATTGFDSRCGRASQRPKIGGNIIYLPGDGKYRVKKFRYQPARREPWTKT